MAKSGVPESDYESHGNDLLDVMSDLAKSYSDKKAAVDQEEAGAVEAEEPPAPTVEINGASYPALADGTSTIGGSGDYCGVVS